LPTTKNNECICNGCESPCQEILGLRAKIEVLRLREIVRKTRTNNKISPEERRQNIDNFQRAEYRLELNFGMKID
jgi:hypothetical protein